MERFGDVGEEEADGGGVVGDAEGVEAGEGGGVGGGVEVGAGEALARSVGCF